MQTPAEHIARLRDLASFRLRLMTERGLDPMIDPLLETVHAACVALEQPSLPALAQRIADVEAEVSQVEERIDGQWQSLQLADEHREQSSLRRQAQLEASVERLERELGSLVEVASRAGWEADEHGALADWLAARLA
jgi:hypothetical protein